MSPAEFSQWLEHNPISRDPTGSATTPQPTTRPLIMGVLNVTPDSFSDGGRYASTDAAVAHGLAMIADGADLLDIGGESTRPGSARTPADEQIRRVTPVIAALANQAGDRCVLSIDTTRAAVARAALDAGAEMINDISAGLDDPPLLALAADRACPLVLMHMRGQPATMQDDPVYADVVAEVKAHLAQRLATAIDAGVARARVLLDPGIGFGKRIEHNLELLRRLAEFTTLGRPLVLGTSRKGFLGRIAGEGDPRDRVMSTAASVAWCIANGAAITRVHDVAAMAKVVRVVRAIQQG